ncbi:MAG: peptidoglycan-binding protein [Cyanobacteria bacterium J06560_2]
MTDSDLVLPDFLQAYTFESCEHINHEETVIRAVGTRNLVRARLIKDATGGATAIANGLSQQLIYQMNLLLPNALVSFEDLNVHLQNAAYPLVQPAAKQALARAIKKRGQPLKLNSIYRTLAQQYLLYRWKGKNPNAVAKPGNSLHQSGLAIDISDYVGWRPFLKEQGWKWYGRGDEVHFTYVGAGTQDLRAVTIKAFQRLWNINHPEQPISEDGAYGKQTETTLDQTPLLGFEIAPWNDSPRTFQLRTPYMTGNDVVALQEKLLSAGLKVEPDGIFGPGSEKAVKVLQQQKGLLADGRVIPTSELFSAIAPNITPIDQPPIEAPESARVPDSPDSTLEPLTDSASSNSTPTSNLLTNNTPSNNTLAQAFILKQGMIGMPVLELQNKLKSLNFLSGKMDGNFGDKTRAAVSSFQKSMNLKADGIVRKQTAEALGISPIAAQTVVESELFSVDRVAKICRGAPRQNIEAYLPRVLRALEKVDCGDRTMILMAIATIRAETAKFEPISEGISKYNTNPGQRPFGKYDFRKDLGNSAEGHGERYKGRGFVQLTGKENYLKYGQAIGLTDRLVEQPELANNAEIAADILARFLKDKAGRIRVALHFTNYKAARKAVNGGTHGLPEFTAAFKQGKALIEAPTSHAIGKELTSFPR